MTRIGPVAGRGRIALLAVLAAAPVGCAGARARSPERDLRPHYTTAMVRDTNLWNVWAAVRDIARRRGWKTAPDDPPPDQHQHEWRFSVYRLGLRGSAWVMIEGAMTLRDTPRGNLVVITAAFRDSVPEFLALPDPPPRCADGPPDDVAGIDLSEAGDADVPVHRVKRPCDVVATPEAWVRREFRDLAAHVQRCARSISRRGIGLHGCVPPHDP